MSKWSALFRALTNDIVDTVDTVHTATAVAPKSVNTVNSVCRQKRSKGSAGDLPTSVDEPVDRSFVKALAALERNCPEYVEPQHWQQAVADGRRFVEQWDDQAIALGWTGEDLFGLHSLPEQPHPSYQRLRRYDELGLIWMLCGRAVVALTATSAAIQTSGGTRLVYRRAR